MKRSNRLLVCEMLERNQAYLLDAAMSLTKNVAEAQDLLQQTSLAILANADNYEEMGCFIGWATKIMRNIHLNNENYKKIRKKWGMMISLPTTPLLPYAKTMKRVIVVTCTISSQPVCLPSRPLPYRLPSRATAITRLPTRQAPRRAR